jgi:hypothetical protein
MLTQEYKHRLHKIRQQVVAQLQNLMHPQVGDELNITLM